MRHFSRLCFGVLLALFGNNCSADDWRSIRGNDGLGRWSDSTLLSSTEKLGLKVRWKKEIGSGYSSVVVSNGLAVTMFTDGVKDQAVCFDVQNGKKVWSFPLEPVFKGANGSFDGPIATPVIHDGKVYCLSARGLLYSLELGSGKEVWKRNLVDEEKAVTPMYGFSTTPLVSGTTLCVLAGAKDGALIGLDLATGTTKWRAGNGQIASQIPMLTNVHGTDLIITGVGKSVIGVDPKSGKQVLRFEHNGANGSAMMPVPFDGDKILLTNDDSFSRVFQIKPSENGFSATEVWSDRSIKNTYNVPVGVKDHFFAYSTRILTCVDQKTGKSKWKSRKPGDGFLIEVDGHLVIVTKKGSLHVAKADADRYQELAKVKVFDNLVWAIPAYADNTILVRSLREIACVEFVNESAGILAKKSNQLPMGTGFVEFISSLKEESESTRKMLVDKFLDSKDVFPIVEDGIAHFVYQGKAKDVAIACDVFGARQEEKMTRVEGTDFFYYTLKLPPKQRVSYIFLVDYKPQKDPRNSRHFTSSMYAGEMEFAIRLQNEKPLEMSWFGMGQWSEPAYLNVHRRERLIGKMIKEEIDLEEGAKFDATVYLPPEYDKNKDRRYPVVYVLGGPMALKNGKLDEVADLFFLSRPDKASIVVFLNSQPARAVLPYLNQVAKKVVPFVDDKYRTIADRKSRAGFGAGFSAGSAMGLATMHADVFGGCAAQSPLVFDQARGMAIDSFQKTKLPTRLYLEWGRYDMHNPVENWDIREMAKTMKKEISKNPKVEILGGQVDDSTDWASWKYRFGTIVEQLFAE